MNWSVRMSVCLFARMFANFDSNRSFTFRRLTTFNYFMKNSLKNFGVERLANIRFTTG